MTTAYHPDAVEGCDYCDAFPDLPCATHRHAAEERRQRSNHYIGYRRDASWWNNPRTTGVPLVHRLGPDGLMARCDSKRIMLNLDQRVFVDDQRLPEDHLCRRCYPRGRPSWDAS